MLKKLILTTISLILLIITILAQAKTDNSMLPQAKRSSITPELTVERCQQLVLSIPDHGKLNKPKTTLSAEYYSTWKEAWEVPDGGLGDMGNDEFLFYFVCGNDPCEYHTSTIESINIDGDTATVKFYINHIMEFGDNPIHTFKLIVENGRWVIADYDTTLPDMKEYIKSQRVYLQSDEYKNRAREILNDPSASEDWKQAVKEELKSVKTYFKKLQSQKTN